MRRAHNFQVGALHTHAAAKSQHIHAHACMHHRFTGTRASSGGVEGEGGWFGSGSVWACVRLSRSPRQTLPHTNSHMVMCGKTLACAAEHNKHAGSEFCPLRRRRGVTFGARTGCFSACAVRNGTHQQPLGLAARVWGGCHGIVMNLPPGAA